MPFIFPDPSVSTKATLPNGEKWEYVDGVWQPENVNDNDAVRIDALEASDAEQDDNIEDLQESELADRAVLLDVKDRIQDAEGDIGLIQGLDLTNALSALAIAQQDIIELKSKVNSLELTSFLILE